MSNPAKVKVSVESQNPTVSFFKNGSASVQSSLVNVGNEFKMKKYIQDSATLEDVMTVNEDGAVKFHKNVTFAGDSVVQNVQTIILQDQKLEIGTTNANQVNSSGVVKTNGVSTYSYGVTSNVSILTTKNLLIGKEDLVNGPGYTSMIYSNDVSRLTSGDYTKVSTTLLQSTTINILPTDSTPVSSLKVFQQNTRFEQNVASLNLSQNNLTISYTAGTGLDKLENLVVGQLVSIDTNNQISNPYNSYLNNRYIAYKYGIIINVDTSAQTLVIKFTNTNMDNSQNGQESSNSSLFFTTATKITDITNGSIMTEPSKYKFTATDTNADFSAIYSTGNYVHFEGLKNTLGGVITDAFNTSHIVTTVGSTFIEVENIMNYEVANFSGSPVFVSKLQSIGDDSGISLIGNASGMYVKGSLSYDNSVNKNLRLENTAGPISIGTDWSPYSVNIGTQGNRSISIGNNTSGQLSINSGNGASISTSNNSNISLTTNNTADTVVTTGQLLVTAKDNVPNSILLTADNGTNQTINIKNQTGTAANSIQLSSDLGGVQINAANEKDIYLGNSNSTVFMKVSPSNTYSSEKISVVNKNGSGDESILLSSEGGGAKFKVANSKNLILGNLSENLFVKLSPNSTVASEKLSIVNTNGTAEDAISLNSIAGGAKFLVADSKNLVLGNSTEDVYFKVSPSSTAANEKISVVNSNGTAADSIFINSVSGGVTMASSGTIDLNSTSGGLNMLCAGAVNLATNNNTSAVNIGTFGNRTITLGVNSGTNKVLIDAAEVVITNGITVSSDIRLKENFEPMSNALDLVSQLNGFYYTWKKDAGTDKPRKIGFIAQEVEKVIPELVKTDSEGMKSVDYVSVVPILVEAFKHQQKQIDELKASLHA
jgi:hypothetical protein